MRCLTALRDDKKGPAIELFTNDPAEEAAFIRAHNRPGITLTRCVGELQDTERKRRINTIASIDHLHVDIDVRGLFATTKEQIVERVKKMPLPLQLIDSGGGIHVKARLKETICIGTREYDRACDLRTELMHVLCGDPAVNHSAALMRIPGTTNFKYGEPILCRELEPGAPVDLIDIETMVDMYQQPIFTRKIGKANSKKNGHDTGMRAARELRNGPLDIEATLENMEFEGGEAGFNNTQWRVVGAMLNRGIATDVIVPMVLEASMKAAARDPRCAEWNWTAERHNMEVMCLRSLEDKEDLYYLLPQRFVDVWEKNVREGKKCKLVNAGGHIGWHVRGYESKEGAEEQTEGKSEEQPQKEMPGVRFRLIRYQDMRPGIEPTYLVDELIPSQGLVLIWGKQKTFKSFWLLDLMLHIAMGWPYRDRAVRQGPVVYCAFEGGHGYKGRIEAQRRHYEISDDTEVPLYVMPGQANLIEEKGKMIADFRVQLDGVKPVIVVLDTLNRSLRGSENNAEDMGNYVAAAEAIRAEFGCVVLIVHHCGYDESHSRGSTALPAAVDAELEVIRNPNDPQLVVTVKNMRDGPEGTVVRSRAERYPLDPGTDGRPKSSIIIVPDETAMVDPSRRGGRPDVAMAPLMAAMWAAIDVHSSQFSPDGKPPVKAVEDRHVRTEFYRRYVDGEETKDASRKAQTEAFKRGIKRAIAAGMMCGQKDDGGQQWLWLPSHAEEYR